MNRKSGLNLLTKLFSEKSVKKPEQTKSIIQNPIKIN